VMRAVRLYDHHTDRVTAVLLASGWHEVKDRLFTVT
jgi:hypothetical protein